MQNFTSLLVFVGVIALLGAAAAVFLASKGRGKAARYSASKIMTNNEAEFFMRLVRACPQEYVFPQVALSALLKPAASDKKERFVAFRAISQRRVDYAIYTDKLQLLCVVELDDRTHDSRKDAQRDRCLESAGIKTIRWHSKDKPNEEAIKARVQALRAASH